MSRRWTEAPRGRAGAGWGASAGKGGGRCGDFFLNSSSKNRSLHYLHIQSQEDERVCFFILI